MENREDIINDILGNLTSDEYVPVELPSRNKGYKFKEGDEGVSIRPMTFEDEKVLANSKKMGKDPLNVLLQRCISTNVDVDGLYLFDKLYLIMKLRQISYGEEYKSLVICQKCSAETEISITIDKIPVDFVDDSFEDPIELTLPKIGKKVKIKIPRVSDEPSLSNLDKLGNNLWKFVLEINGVSDKTIISEVVKKLPLVDTKTIINALNVEKGIQTKFHYECDECGGGSVMNLPIDENFFNVN